MTDESYNKLPVNQVCLRLLKQENQQPDPQVPYCLQLAKWGLENFELVGPWKQSQPDLLLQLEILEDPKLIHKVLFNRQDLGEWAKELENLSPRQAACFLIENLFYYLRPQ